MTECLCVSENACVWVCVCVCDITREKQDIGDSVCVCVCGKERGEERPHAFKFRRTKRPLHHLKCSKLWLFRCRVPFCNKTFLSYWIAFKAHNLFIEYKRTLWNRNHTVTNAHWSLDQEIAVTSNFNLKRFIVNSTIWEKPTKAYFICNFCDKQLCEFKSDRNKNTLFSINFTAIQ